MLRAEIFPCATGSSAPPGLWTSTVSSTCPVLASVCRNCQFRYSVRENYCQRSATTFRHEANCSPWIGHMQRTAVNPLSIVRVPRGSPIVNSKVSHAFARGHFSLHVSHHILSSFILLLPVVQRAWSRFVFALWELPCVSSLVPSEAASRSGSFAPVLLS